MPLFENVRWSLDSAKYRWETVRQVDEIERQVRRSVDRCVPEDPAGEHERVLLAARTRVFTALARSILPTIPSTVEGRRYWLRAVENAPRSHPSRTHRRIPVEVEVRRDFWDRFQFSQTSREAKRKDPHLTAFGYLVESLDNQAMQRLVSESLRLMPELQGVSGSAAPLASSSSS